MKKYIFAAAAVAICSLGASAQYDYSNANRLDSIETAMANANARMAELRADSISQSVWRGKGYFNVGYSISSTSNEHYATEKGSYGAFINLGTSWIWPKKHAIGNIFKIGLDVRWIDIDFTNFPNFNRYLTNPENPVQNTTNYEGWVNDMTVNNSSAPTQQYYTFSHMQLLGGAFGIGPTLTIAPFATMDNAANSLRINLYFHYQPTACITFYKAKEAVGINSSYFDDDINVEAGYVSMLDFGGRLQWRNIGIGIEGRWGSGKMSDTHYYMNNAVYINGNSYYNFNINGTPEYNDAKYTRKFGQTRIFFDVAF